MNDLEYLFPVKVSFHDLRNAHPKCESCKWLDSDKEIKGSFYCASVEWGMDSEDIKTEYCSEWKAKE